MSDSGIKIEVHLIQNFAPSNLNRDDTGQPKSATFGGFRRARISSQCSKRSTRQLWRENGTVSVGERTKLLKAELAPHLAAPGRSPEQVQTAVNTFLTQFYSKMDGEKTAVLLFVSRKELDACVHAINANWDALSAGNQVPNNTDQAISASIRQAGISADIALFGRMLAEQPGRNTDGACQVAHPMSTHRVDMEMDFYTAVDDLNPAGETGAGMMGVTGFNSACYYRYALVDRDQLVRNLTGKLHRDRSNGRWTHSQENNLTAQDYAEADRVIKAFLEAMVYAIPTGKQNSFAAHNPPSFGMFVRRESGVPVSLANAFAKPVRPGKEDDDLVGLSIAALAKHWHALKETYGDQGARVISCFQVDQKSRLNGLAGYDKGSVTKAINEVLGMQEG